MIAPTNFARIRQHNATRLAKVPADKHEFAYEEIRAFDLAALCDQARPTTEDAASLVAELRQSVATVRDPAKFVNVLAVRLGELLALVPTPAEPTNPAAATAEPNPAPASVPFRKAKVGSTDDPTPAA